MLLKAYTFLSLPSYPYTVVSLISNFPERSSVAQEEYRIVSSLCQHPCPFPGLNCPQLALFSLSFTAPCLPATWQETYCCSSSMSPTGVEVQHWVVQASQLVLLIWRLPQCTLWHVCYIAGAAQGLLVLPHYWIRLPVYLLLKFLS